MAHGGVGSADAQKAKARRTELLVQIRNGVSLADACKAVNWSTSAYRKNRTNWVDWATEVDMALNRKPRGQDPEFPGLNRQGLKGFQWNPKEGFASFRRYFLGMESPWFHLLAIEAIESMPQGSVLLILWPPEHGKTALWEDYDTYLLATQPQSRIAVGSEKRDQAGKVTGLVRSRLEHDATGMEKLRERFGPFAPARGGGRQAANQRWGQYAFDVAKKPHGIGGQRDPSMQAIGMSGTIIGTRTDVLQVDDPQSFKSLKKTEQLVGTFRQDWLSRPGAFGRTAILANRVGENDFHEYLMEKTDIVDRVIQIPAWDPIRGWAWPERYSHQEYLGMKRRAGEEAWERNFMQIGLVAKDATFNNARIGKCKNPLRSIVHAPPRHPAGGPAEVIVTMDPGFGVTAIHAGAIEPTRFRSLDTRRYEGVKAYSQFGELLEEWLLQFNVPGISTVTDVVIETKAFQKGLINDEKILELKDQHGFALHPFETGLNKSDPDIGIGQMARSMDRGEIDFPDGDELTQARYESLYREMLRWKPGVKGNVLVQDQLMTLWFGWYHWRMRRRNLANNPSNFDFGGLRTR